MLHQALCRGYPSEFATYFHYCRSLRFDDKPDYAYLKGLFRGLFIHEGIICLFFFCVSDLLYQSVQHYGLRNPGFQCDFVFDWTILKYQQSQLATPPARPLVFLCLFAPLLVLFDQFFLVVETLVMLYSSDRVLLLELVLVCLPYQAMLTSLLVK